MARRRRKMHSYVSTVLWLVVSKDPNQLFSIYTAEDYRFVVVNSFWMEIFQGCNIIKEDSALTRPKTKRSLLIGIDEHSQLGRN